MLLRTAFALVEIVVGLLAAYLVMLGAAATAGHLTRARKNRSSARVPRTRFALLIPAHDEELLIGALLGSLERLDYPANLYDTYVVADNCTDGTARIVRESGAECRERTDEGHIGKGHALRWLIDGLLEEDAEYDAYIVFDADSEVTPSFLRVMDAELASGRTDILQGYYTIKNVEASWLTAVSALGFSLYQYVKPLGRTTLGLPTRLLGNGMCFPSSVVARHRWGAFSISEDLDFYLSLTLLGHRTRFVPDAVVAAQMPTTTGGARTQRVRWERGKLLAQKSYLARLVASGVQTRRWAPIDAAIDLVTPPFTTLVLLMFAIGAAGYAVAPLRPAFAASAWWVLIAGLAAYVATGALLTGIPLRVLAKSAVVAPFFAIWKTWILLLATVGINDDTWVRTPR